MKILKYPINNSPLYNLQSKKKLKQLLYIDNSESNYFAKQENIDNEYHPFVNKKGRDIDNPSKRLKKIHSRIQKLLSRIIYPKYLYSAAKRSNIKNVLKHRNHKYMFKTDIYKFFPSSKKEYIFRAFKYNFQMSEDIAWYLANLVCYNNHLATGSPVSTILSFWGYKDVFDSIYALAKRRGITMSLFVDDMAFSSNKYIPISFKSKIEKYLKDVDLILSPKPSKNIFYKSNEEKKLTGAIITTDKKLKILPETELTIKNLLNNIEELNLQKLKSLLGMLQYQKQVEKNNANISKQISLVKAKIKDLISK